MIAAVKRWISAESIVGLGDKNSQLGAHLMIPKDHASILYFLAYELQVL